MRALVRVRAVCAASIMHCVRGVALRCAFGFDCSSTLLDATVTVGAGLAAAGVRIFFFYENRTPDTSRQDLHGPMPSMVAVGNAVGVFFFGGKGESSTGLVGLLGVAGCTCLCRCLRGASAKVGMYGDVFAHV